MPKPEQTLYAKRRYLYSHAMLRKWGLRKRFGLSIPYVKPGLNSGLYWAPVLKKFCCYTVFENEELLVSKYHKSKPLFVFDVTTVGFNEMSMREFKVSRKKPLKYYELVDEVQRGLKISLDYLQMYSCYEASISRKRKRS